MKYELNVLNYQQFVVCLKKATKELKYASEFGSEEIKELFDRVQEIYEREHKKCLQLLIEMDMYPTYDI